MSRMGRSGEKEAERASVTPQSIQHSQSMYHLLQNNLYTSDLGENIACTKYTLKLLVHYTMDTRSDFEGPRKFEKEDWGRIHGINLVSGVRVRRHGFKSNSDKKFV